VTYDREVQDGCQERKTTLPDFVAAKSLPNFSFKLWSQTTISRLFCRALLDAKFMARRRRVFAPGVLYHVIVQGNQPEKTFTSDGDYQAYRERLA
jgi:hypothetical protein